METYSSLEPAGLVLGALERRCLARGSRVSEPPCDAGAPRERRGQLAAERGQVDAEPPQRLGGDAVVGFEQGGEEVLRVEDGALGLGGEALGGERSPPGPSGCSGRGSSVECPRLRSSGGCVVWSA